MTTAVQLAQSVAPGVSLGFKNRIINGGMAIAQRGTSVTLPSGGSATYGGPDRWRGVAPISQNATGAQSSNAPTGFNYSYLYTAGTGSTNANDQSEVAYFIEGYNVADFGFGAAGAKTFTISFWVKSSLTGSFGVAFENADATRTYSTTYTISSANTWEQKSVTIIGDSSGTWDKTTGRGLGIFFDLGHGTSRSQAATNAWVNDGGSASYRGVTGAVKLTQTTGATWQITGVQLEVGTTATPFEFRDYGRELILCQRYYYRIIPTGAQRFLFGYAYNSTIAICNVIFPVQMRVQPASIDTSGTASDYQISYLTTQTACSVVPVLNQANTLMSNLVVTVASGLTGGHGVAGGAATTNGYIGWSAEL